MGEEVNATGTLSLATGPTTPEHFVLVHGISHGGWCWYKVQALLEKSGHKVTSLDLAGSGIHMSHADQVLTFEQYDQPLYDLMASLPENDKVVLVGHSAGGLNLTRASHLFGNKIRLAIYIAATMLRSGYHSRKDFEDGVPDLSEYGDVYKLGFSLGPDMPPTSALIRKQFQQKILYQLSPIEDSVLGSSLLRPGPVMALQTARFSDDDGVDVDKVRRVFIRTTCDPVLKPKQQEAMIQRWPPSDVWTIDSDHSPFFSNPAQLCDLMLKSLALLHPPN